MKPTLPPVMRFGGTLGIIGVLLFILATFGLSLEDTSYVAPAYSATLNDLLRDERPSANLPDNSLLSQFIHLSGHIVAPLFFLSAYQALAAWQRDHQPQMGGWLAQIAFLGISLWIINGVLRVIAIPSLLQADPDFLLTPTPVLLVFSLANSLVDGAYLLLAIHAAIMGSILRRQGYLQVGTAGILNGSVTAGVILAGPFDSLTLLNLFAYGAIAVWIFAFSAVLLVEADKAAMPPPRL